MGALPRLLPIVATVAVGFAQALAWRSTSPGAVWLILGGALLPLLFVALLVLARDEALRDALRIVAGDLSRGIGGAFLAILVIAAIGFAFVRLASGIATTELSALLQVRAAIGREATRGALVIGFAFAEEMIFRGAVTHALEERFGSRRAPWVASALYVLATVPSLRPSVIGAAIVISAVSASVVATWRRPMIAVIAHAAFAWVSMELVTPILWAKLGSR
jgi:membrane protease YdiL (CAAX protease family)